MTDYERELLELGFSEEEVKCAVQKQGDKHMLREIYDEDRRISERERRRNRNFRNIKSLKRR